MIYTPKEWQCDDYITAGELNRMERGIQEAMGDSVFKIVTHTENMSDLTSESSTGRITVTPTAQERYRLVGIVGAKFYSETEGFDRIIRSTGLSHQEYVDDDTHFSFVVANGNSGDYVNWKATFTLLYLKSND